MQQSNIESPFNLFKNKEEIDYPLKLLKIVKDDQRVDYERNMAESLFEHWVSFYIENKQSVAKRYQIVFNSVIRQLYSAVIKYHVLQRAASLIYYQYYMKQNSLTQYLKMSISNSQPKALRLLWLISFRISDEFEPIKQHNFVEHLSREMGEPLLAYKWKRHGQKIEILQIIRHITTIEVSNSFAVCSNKWVQKIKAMMGEEFRSEIKGKDQYKVSVYQYDNRVERQGTGLKMITKSIFHDKISEGSIDNEMKDVIKKNPIEVNPFFYVADQKEEKQAYQLQLKSEVVLCWFFLFAVDPDFWKQTVTQILDQIDAKINIFTKNNRIDLMYIKIFKRIMNIDQVEKILIENYLDNFTVNIVKNLKYQSSPFPDHPTILQKLNELSFEGCSERQVVIMKRINFVIVEAKKGIDDLKNRSLLQINLQDQIKLSQHYMKRLFDILTSSKFRDTIPIESYLILSKVYLTALKTLKKINVDVILLSKEYPIIIESQKSGKVHEQLREISIKILGRLLEISVLEIHIEQIFITSIFDWLQKIQANSTSFYLSMMELMYYIHREKFKIFKNLNFDSFDQIMEGMVIKLNESPSTRNIFVYLNCVFEAVYRYQWSRGSNIQQRMSMECFRDYRIVYLYQAKLLLMPMIKKGKSKIVVTEKKPKRSQKSKNILAIPINEEEEKALKIEELKQKLVQEFQFYFQQEEQKRIKEFIRSLYLAETNEYQHIFFISFLQYRVLSYMNSVDTIYIEQNWSDKFVGQFLLELDSDLLKLFTVMCQNKKYERMYKFASQLYYLCRDYGLIQSLASYQFLKKNCFNILSYHFSKNEVLSAASFFCSILIPYRDSPELQHVYEKLNEEQFITDLFKGADQFISAQSDYTPTTMVTILAFWLTIPFRQRFESLQTSMIYLKKNLVWWGQVDYITTPQLFEDHKQSKKQQVPKILPKFKEKFTQILKKYYIENLKCFMEKKLGQIVD